ncbi:hypothetical protein CK227_24085 [Mesorhizobium sp. WSM4308]|nr:hypothetical protein CK232_25275 [Mesorhizobium sp. WSM4304]PBB72776.1 hypothetical protein CK227_24085 [Mesorhizobium sp. WSM4308]
MNKRDEFSLKTKMAVLVAYQVRKLPNYLNASETDVELDPLVLGRQKDFQSMVWSQTHKIGTYVSTNVSKSGSDICDARDPA